MISTLSAGGGSRPLDLGLPHREGLARLEHELRTPLTVIGLAAHVLERSVRDGDGRCALESLRKASDRLERVVEDLLLLRRLSTPGAAASPSPFRLEEVVRDAVHAASAEAVERGVSLTLSVHGGAQQVLGEAAVVARAVEHLLRNALAYTPRGFEVAVALQPLQRGYEVSVCDAGPGVPADAIAGLFEPFHQLSHPLTRELGGLGIGLTIVRLVAEGHRGTVTAFSRPGQGSCFGLWLPAASARSL